jgi:hypothetical protein
VLPGLWAAALASVGSRRTRALARQIMDSDLPEGGGEHPCMSLRPEIPRARAPASAASNRDYGRKAGCVQPTVGLDFHWGDGILLPRS